MTVPLTIGLFASYKYTRIRNGNENVRVRGRGLGFLRGIVVLEQARVQDEIPTLPADGQRRHVREYKGSQVEWVSIRIISRRCLLCCVRGLEGRRRVGVQWCGAPRWAREKG